MDIPENEPGKILGRSNRGVSTSGSSEYFVGMQSPPARIIGKSEPDFLKEPKERAIQQVVIYKDNQIIEKVREQVTAQLLQDLGLSQKLKRTLIDNRLLFTADTLRDEESNKLVVKPSAKSAYGESLDVEMGIRRLLDTRENMNMVVFTLSQAMQECTVQEIVKKHRQQKSVTPINDLIYPNMPIKLIGQIDKADQIQSNQVQVSYKNKIVTVVFNNENKLSQAFAFLKRRPFIVLGTILDIKDDLRIETGALLLTHKVFSSIEESD